MRLRITGILKVLKKQPMRKLHSAVIAILLFALSTSLSASTKYFSGNLEAARVKAEMEGKMLLIDFYATWCGPCKWMEETTFADESVSSLINSKFVPLKIDIDDFDGYALKEHFGVKVLPTFLIFNEEGKIVERVEETLPPSKMKAVLERSLTVFTPKVHETNISPSKAIELATKEERKSKFEERTIQSSYKLQLGMFSSYEQTLNYYNQVSGILEDPVIIMHDYKAGQVIYRVLIGNFSSTSEAHYFQSDLKGRFNIDSHIYI